MTCGPWWNAQAAHDADRRISRFFQEVNTYEADFIQKVFDEDGGLVQRATGILKLKRPGRFLWEYLEPSPQLILADGDNLWIYDAELEQATVKPIDEALGTAPIALLTGSRPLSENFDVTQAGARDGLKWIELTPHTQDTEFRRIGLGMDGKAIKQMDLHDQFGQKTVIRFENIRTNAPIPDTRFEFDAPEDVDIIGVPQ
jgi:outer membrane lipoprotein carrier protein